MSWQNHPGPLLSASGPLPGQGKKDERREGEHREEDRHHGPDKRDMARLHEKEPNGKGDYRPEIPVAYPQADTLPWCSLSAMSLRKEL